VTAPGDYHVHTTWSDGTGSVEECVLRAVELGLPEIGIADHVSTAPGPDEDWWVALDRMGAYCEDVRSAAWEKAHDKAFRDAATKLKPDFRQCPRCSSWVCRRQC
jgi:histidinol phosphatase-like PHP family hydrolase